MGELAEVLCEFYEDPGRAVRYARHYSARDTDHKVVAASLKRALDRDQSGALPDFIENPDKTRLHRAGV